MSATLSIINNFELPVQGNTVSGKQGAATSAVTDTFDVTVDGKILPITSQIATATVTKIWDDDTHQPTDFDYFFFWCDQDVYLQFVGSTTNFTIKVLAKAPQTLTYDQLLAAANTTDITGGTEPTMEDIDHINVGNYSGSAANYVFAVID